MYCDTPRFARNCPECATVSGGGGWNGPHLHPIPVQKPFQIIGCDGTSQDGQWDQLCLSVPGLSITTAHDISDAGIATYCKVLVEEVVPLFGVPEALLSD